MNSDSKVLKELPDGWMLCRSKTNPSKQYYFHQKTRKSSWTRPQLTGKLDTKRKKKEPPNQSQEKKKNECSKSVKRKSDGTTAGSSEKKHKNEPPENNRKKKILKATARRTQNNNSASLSKIRLLKKTPSKCTLLDQSPTKSQSFSHTPSKNTSLDQSTSKCTSFKTLPKPQSLNHSPKCKSLNEQSKTPTQHEEAELNVSPAKNLASSRLSQLRARLSAEAKIEDNVEPNPKKNKSRLISSPCETPVALQPALRSPAVSKPVHSTPNTSPSNNPFFATPSQSKFIAPTKLNCSNMPVSVNSSTSHTPKDVKTFSSAKDRMEALRASISGDIDEQELQDDAISNCPVTPPDIVMPLEPYTPPTCEAMEVEDIRETSEQHPTRPLNEVLTTFQSPSSISEPNGKEPISGSVVLVVDTNIFIHELDVIKNILNSHIKGYSGQPRLMVPWRVITELDRLKASTEAGGVAKRARDAMDFLYKTLPEDTRIKGQSLRDANSHIYPCESPDDEILNCALQQVERGNNVLLLSNDRNLCVKAAANGVRGRGAAGLAAAAGGAQRPRGAAARERAQRVRLCERALQSLLSRILQSEMRTKYDDLWLRVVAEPPPWRLAVAVRCLLKHWRAVFVDVLPGLETPLKCLRASLAKIEDRDLNSLTEAELTKFSDLCLEVARKCLIVPEYMNLAKMTVELLVRGESETHGVTHDAGASETHDAGASETAIAAFESLWLVMSSYSAKLATARGVAHCLEDKLPSGEVGDPGALRGAVAGLVQALERVLDTRDAATMEERTLQLHAAFAESLRLARAESSLTCGQLEQFCVKNRNMLQEALNKFSQLARLLDSCGYHWPRPDH